MAMKNFIMNHLMRLAIFEYHVKLKLLSVVETRFASPIVMLKRFKTIKRVLQDTVLCERWASDIEDDVGKAAFIKEKILFDLWWDKVYYILAFTEPIYEMLRKTYKYIQCLHLVHDM